MRFLRSLLYMVWLIVTVVPYAVVVVTMAGEYAHQ